MTESKEPKRDLSFLVCPVERIKLPSFEKGKAVHKTVSGEKTRLGQHARCEMPIKTSNSVCLAKRLQQLSLFSYTEIYPTMVLELYIQLKIMNKYQSLLILQVFSIMTCECMP